MLFRSINLCTWRVILVLSGGALLTTGAIAQQSTVPVGYIRWTLPATGGSELRTTLNFPLGSLPVFSGPVATLTANTISVSAAPFVANAYVSTPSFVRFLSGTQAGRTIRVLANTANSLTLDTSDNGPQTVALDAPGFSIAAADRFEIVPALTIGSVFGGIAGKPLLLTAGTDEGTADEIAIYNQRTLAWEYYYYSSGVGHWVRAGSTAEAGNTIVQPDDAVLIVRRAGRAAVDVVTLGSVPTVMPLTKVTGSNQPKYASTRYPIPLTLAQLSFSNWVKNNSAFKADTISVWNAVTQAWDGYFQRLDGTWRKSGDSVTDQSNVSIPEGTVVGIVKRASVSGATSFVSTPLPYTL